MCGIPLAEAVAICPAAPYVAPDYFRAVSQLLTEAERTDAAPLHLMGIEFTYPRKIRYILPESCDAQRHHS
ncbi:hypothetical protein [Selenomonas sp. F0473]|uniref:hypothetical protein n=1 Tax=Selenomonas sp. F0473 TaxID=999423 RepID=UPI0003003FAF